MQRHFCNVRVSTVDFTCFSPANVCELGFSVNILLRRKAQLIKVFFSEY
jgi:hypothetical protein